jgi:hypothetical protein
MRTMKFWFSAIFCRSDLSYYILFLRILQIFDVYLINLRDILVEVLARPIWIKLRGDKLSLNWLASHFLFTINDDRDSFLFFLVIVLSNDAANCVACLGVSIR